MNALVNMGTNRFHYMMAAGVITTDLWPHLKQGEYKETFRKAKNIGLIFFSQHLLKRWFPGLHPSGKFMVGVMCYTRLSSRDNNFAVSLTVAVATVALGIRSLVANDHGVLDLFVAAGIGKILGVFWNYALD